jgi:hypothetical protein
MKRNVFSIDCDGMVKEAFAVGAIMTAVRLALPYIGRAAVRLGGTYLVEKAVNGIVSHGIRFGTNKLLSRLGGKELADVQKLLGSASKSNQPFMKNLMGDSKSKSVINDILGAEKKDSADEGERSGGQGIRTNPKATHLGLHGELRLANTRRENK